MVGSCGAGDYRREHFDEALGCELTADHGHAPARVAMKVWVKGGLELSGEHRSVWKTWGLINMKAFVTVVLHRKNRVQFR